MQSQKYNILVTGCGGDIGQSIGKILADDPRIARRIGADMDVDTAARFIYQKMYSLPRVDDPSYAEQLQNIIKAEQIDMVIPMAEAELRMYAEKGTAILQDTIVLTANREAMQVGFDKLTTVQFLEANGLPYPRTELLDENTSLPFPFLIKSRKGAGGKDLFIVNDKEEAVFYRKKFPGHIAQELVGAADLEYTCGLFRSSAGETRQIIFRRKLQGGYSGFGVYEENKSIEQLLIQLAELLNLRGSINVQLRLTEQGPCVFEINPRFSSTVLFRHLMGFHDLLWSIDDAIGQVPAPYVRNTKLSKFYKGYHEYVD